MIKDFFGFKLATYSTADRVIKSEIEQADIVEFQGKVDGGIYHSQSMLWVGDVKNIESSTEMIRSKKERKLIGETIAWFESQHYQFEILPMTESLYGEFEQLYVQTTLNRERPLQYSLQELVLSLIKLGQSVFLIGLFKQHTLESALVFSVTSDGKKAKVSFGAKKRFNKRRGGVGGVFESLLIDFCIKNGIEEISHGIGKNPTGLTAKSGLFEFKSRYGFSAYPEGPWKTTFIRNPKVLLSDLVFVTIIDNQIGYLVVSDDSQDILEKKYQTHAIRLIKKISLSAIIQAGLDL